MLRETRKNNIYILFLPRHREVPHDFGLRVATFIVEPVQGAGGSGSGVTIDICNAYSEYRADGVSLSS